MQNCCELMKTEFKVGSCQVSLINGLLELHIVWVAYLILSDWPARLLLIACVGGSVCVYGFKNYKEHTIHLRLIKTKLVSIFHRQRHYSMTTHPNSIVTSALFLARLALLPACSTSCCVCSLVSVLTCSSNTCNLCNSPLCAYNYIHLTLLWHWS